MATAAMIGGSLLGAASSRSASKKQSKSVDRATEAQLQASRDAQQYTKEAATQARGDVNRLFGQQEQNTRAGIQAGLDLYGQTIPSQFEQARQGNLNAQQQLSQGVQQQNNAILGGAIDYSQFQPQQTQAADTSMFNVQMPNYTFTDGTDTFTPQPDPTQEPQTNQFQQPAINNWQGFGNNGYMGGFNFGGINRSRF